MAFGWKLYGDGRTPPLGEAVAPDDRLSWPQAGRPGVTGSTTPRKGSRNR